MVAEQVTTTPGSARQDAERVSQAGDDHQQERDDHREDDMTADDESDEKLCITSGTRPREREKTDTKVNTELSAVVNHLAKLNDSGDVKAI